MDLEPQELLPAMPPMVQRAWVDGSTGKTSFSARNAVFSWPSTTPGSTVAVSVAASTFRTRFKCFEQSMTRARLTVWPHWLVPPPRGSTGISSSRAIANAAATSSMVRGTITPSGSIW